MRLLLYGLNFAPEPTGVGKFTGEMAAWLAGRGHDVRAVTAPPYYPAWRRDRSVSIWGEQEWRGVKIHRAPLYVPRRPSGARRILHLGSFAAASLPLALWQSARFRPDAVIAFAPTLMAAPGALAAAALGGALSWLHLQDFETEAAFGLGLVKGDAARRAALAAEGWLLRRFDRLSAISEPMRRRLLQKGVPLERTALLPNWVDLDAIRPLTGVSPLKARLGLPARALIALYAGTLGEKQGLEVLAEVARLLPSEPQIMIAIAGEGPARGRLAEAAAATGRLRLLPLQPAERLNDLLGLADIHLLPERAEASDLVMPSKLGGMLASGRPVIAAVRREGTVAAALDGSGLVVPPGDAAQLAEAILALATDPARRAACGAAARAAASRDWDRERILTGFEARLMGAMREGSRRIVLSDRAR
jgi:colanic acid biosynthesis glycosyl transferase WcaI